MANYFKLRTGLSRKDCTELVQYFCEDVTGLCSVNVYADGFVSMSPIIPKEKMGNKLIQVPLAAVPCTATEYAEAHALYVIAEAKRKKEADDLKSLRRGMTRNEHAAEEAGAAEPLSLAHFLDDFTVFDTETTGTDPQRNRITELAAVRYVNWQEVGRMQSFMRCDQPVPPFITKLTGITDAHVRQAPLPKAVLQQFRQLAGESLLVGHNVVFDLRMVEGTRDRMGAVQPLPNQSLCTWAVAATRYPGPHKLGGLCERFGIPSAGAHRAMVDVLMTYELLRYMHQAQPIGAELIGASAQGKKVPVRKPEQATLFAAA